MRFLLLLLLCSFHGILFAQGECDGSRYLQEVFSGADLTSDITYGQNYDVSGNSQSLELDIYQPTGDTASLRPLIVLEHGGSFVFGDKAAVDITSLAEPLARMGYVVASVEYRLGMEGFPFPGPDSSDASEAVWRAVADFKAAVRWFHKDAANGNTYRIDTNRLYIGGVSAGAIAAIHYAYLDDIAEMPAYIDTSKVGLGGGIEGASGNPGYSSDIDGVINISGMIADSAWIQPGDEPIVSLHGTEDDVVPYGTDIIYVLGSWPVFEVDGSSSIHARMNEKGVNNCFYTHYGAGHTPHVSDQASLDTTLNVIRHFMYGLVCGGGGQCGYIVGNDAPLAGAEIAVWPNPASGALRVRVPVDISGAWQYRLTDLMGREVLRGQVRDGNEARIDARPAPGVYLMQVSGGFGTQTKRVVFE